MDISLENPEIKDYMEIEPMLKVDRLKKVGHIWAGDDGLKNYKVSPLFRRSMICLKSIFFLVREMCYTRHQKVCGQTSRRKCRF